MPAAGDQPADPADDKADDAVPAGPDNTTPDDTAVGPPAAAPTAAQSSLAAPRGLSYAVDIVFCIDVTGSMNPIIDAVKADALGFYDDGQANLTEKGKNVEQLRVRLIAFRDFLADGDAALEESPFFTLPAERSGFSEFVNGLIAQGGGDAPESGLEAVALAVNSSWTTTGDRRRQVIVVWTDQPAQPLDPAVVPADLSSRVPADFNALTDLWEDEQGLMGSSSKRLILFAPMGPAGATSPLSGRTWCTIPRRPAAVCPRSTTERSSTPSATRCDRRSTDHGDRRTNAQGVPGQVASHSPAAGPTVSFGFNLGKIPGQGEDADPILRDGPDLALLAVFDGMGGAGGTVYETPDGPRSGAYLASRIARDVVEDRMLDLLVPDWNLNGAAAAEDLRRSVQQALQERLAELHAPKSGLRSRLLRALPTTMAVLALQRTPTVRVEVAVPRVLGR